MAMTLITTATADDDATVEFTSSIDSTYKLFIFKWFDVNPASDGEWLGFQGNASSQSGYNETITSSTFLANQSEADDDPALAYQASYDQAQGTAFQQLTVNVGGGADESAAGTLWLFNPSNTTYVKHFYSTGNEYYYNNYSLGLHMAGYFNVTAAITNIQFKFSSGNITAGTFKMYGVG